MEPITIRASEAHRAIMCPASLTYRKSNHTSEDAERGNKLHRMIASYIISGKMPDLRLLNQQERVLWFNFLRIVNELSEWLVEPKIEIQYLQPVNDALILSGHPDLIDSECDGFTLIPDWKSGAEDDGVWDQLKTYAALDMLDCQNGSIAVREKYILVAAWLQTGIYEAREITTADIDKHIAKLVHAATHTGERQTGRHCTYCPAAASGECPAFNRSLQMFKRLDLDQEQIDKTVALLPESELIRSFQMSKTIEKVCERFKKAAETRLQACGGRLDDGNMEMVREVFQTRRTVSDAAISVIDPIISKAELFLACEPSLSDLTGIIYNRTEKGKKKAAADEFKQRLTDAGCVVEKPVYTIRIREKQKEIE